MADDRDSISEEFDKLDTNFVRPPEKSIKDIVNADTEDASLQKYKKELLGLAATSEDQVILFPENPEHVIVKNISLISEGAVKCTMDLPAPNDFTLTVKEGCNYNIRITYFVQREIVSGLRYTHRIKRLGVPLDREVYMFGSFAPRKEAYEYTSPAEEAPTGMLHRGKYNITSSIVDDDKHTYLKWHWVLEIAKDW
uniref:Rho GDP-dissociation inhibitor 1 n=1 Tax=Panagrellus redivivus TaxID=6233 RepID=A0A7E4ZSC0_PANRE